MDTIVPRYSIPMTEYSIIMKKKKKKISRNLRYTIRLIKFNWIKKKEMIIRGCE